jgi:hypothetical protein
MSKANLFRAVGIITIYDIRTTNDEHNSLSKRNLVPSCLSGKVHFRAKNEAVLRKISKKFDKFALFCGQL